VVVGKRAEGRITELAKEVQTFTAVGGCASQPLLSDQMRVYLVFRMNGALRVHKEGREVSRTSM
jgi:hypothetical protein